jgi:spore germination cell wall hydrolase CwlJ-like protein
LTTLTRPATRAADPQLWLLPISLLIVLGGLAMLAATLVSQRAPAPVAPAPRRVAVVPAPVPIQAEEAAVLLNNTPLAIAPDDAVALNAARALDRVSLTAARPFLLPALTPAPRGAALAALECLTQAVYYEAAVESDTGQRAVAQVVLNRMRHPIFPKSVCGVVYQGSELKTGCQFSFTCDGSLARRPSIAGWARARRIAAAALAGHVERAVGLSTHYHANYVVPYWASSLDKAATIGAHIFYAMRGPGGRAGAFRGAYDAGGESRPLLAIDLAGLDTLGEGERLAGGSERTVVAEDALGAPSASAKALPTPKVALRADERRGQLLADREAPMLDGGR